MAIETDFEIQLDKDIRHVSGTACYTVLELHRWLQDLADDAAASGDDYMDITVLTPSERSYDTIITLVNGFNIDDHAARFLYDGSIIQSGGDVIYDGLVVYAPAGTNLELIQNGAPITPNFWGTGINANAAQGISHRFIMKVRTGGVDIDGRKILGQTRTWGKQFSEFLVNGTSRGNNTIAVASGSDLNNATAEATIEEYTTIANVEGYQGIDVDGDDSNEYYYSKWDKATYSINTLFERAKWLSAEPRTEDSCADVGTDFTIGNATITGQAQSLQNGANATWLAHVKVQLKKTGSPTGNAVAKLYANLNAFGGGDDVPTGAALATSENVDVSKLSTTYETIEFGFMTSYKMTTSTSYCIAIEYTGGDASNYIQIRGLATTGTHGGNRAQKNGTWAAVAADDLNFDLKTVGNLYALSGNLFRGITHEVAIGTPTGTFNAVEMVTWSGGTGMMLAIDSLTAGTKMWIQLLTGAAPTDTQVITGSESSATATASGTATERDIPEKGSLPFFGASTGTAMIGAYGVGVEASDLTANDKLFDLTNTQRIPPNNVTFSVLGLEVGEDYILVGPKAAGNDYAFNQLTLATSLSGATETAVVVTTAIPGDTPKPTGTIRIQLDSGRYRKVSYTSWTGSTFTIPSTDFSGDPATQPRNVMVSYLDKLAASATESFTSVYQSDRNLWIKGRDGGSTPIKTFETSGVLGLAGGSATMIRTSDA